MKLFNVEVYNGGVSGNSTNNWVYSPIQLAALLGTAEKYFCVGTVTQATSGASITIKIQHSNDGENWVDKATLVAQSALTVNTVNVLGMSDSGSTPGGAYVRFAIQMGGANDNCNLRLLCTGHGEQNFL